MITFCNNDPFSTAYSKLFIQNYLNTTDINQQILDSGPLNNKTDSYYLQSSFFSNLNYGMYSFLLQSTLMNETEKRKQGNTLDDILISCTFGLNQCDKTEDFEYFYTFLGGNCFRFNSGKNMNGLSTQIKKVSQPGFYNGTKSFYLFFFKENFIFFC